MVRRRRFFTVLAGVMLALSAYLGLVATASASSLRQIANSSNSWADCPYVQQYDVICMAEDLNGGGNKLQFIGFSHNAGVYNLNGYNVTVGDKQCGGAGLVQNDWNDCFTSLSISLQQDEICFYTDAGYTGQAFRISTSTSLGVVYNDLRTYGYNDNISSFRWRYAGESCFGA